MAKESALWQRVRKAGKHLARCGFGVHMTRIENACGLGTPDVEGSIDGQQIWVELKSCKRPVRPTTVIRPKVREGQDIWLGDRVKSGFRHCYVLIQVGESHKAKLYLIPGDRYGSIIATEAKLQGLSVLSDPSLPVAEVLMRATEGF